jgi:hypothetical protein
MAKGMSLNEFGGLALAFVIVAIIISITGTILTQTQSTQCTGGTVGYNSTTHACGTDIGLYNTSTVASNATAQGLSGITTMSQWLPTIAVIVAAAVVVGVIVNYFRAG